jgi:uncharacterized protein
MEVDIARKRIALTLRLGDELPAKRKDVGSAPQRGGKPAPRREAERPPAAAGAMANAFARLKR